ncbi:MAG: hypothetical protein QY326_08400 [Bdellovibrionota bacterium]|nr:MAG: hypothetical protein QY326_08400 [Bdellovibrionota bacterium]
MTDPRAWRSSLYRFKNRLWWRFAIVLGVWLIAILLMNTMSQEPDQTLVELQKSEAKSASTHTL